MFFNQTRLAERFSLHTDIQYRSYEIAPNLEQLLMRGGVNFHLQGNAMVTAGYARIINYAFDKEVSPGSLSSENRIWQQFFMRNSVGRVSFEHRYRLEQRWINGNPDLYLDRFRYFLRATVPIGKSKVEANTFFLSVYDELFIHLTDTPFDRNRLYGALGYQITPLVNVQLGYMAQTVGTTTKSYLQAALFYNLDLRKQE